jgi:carbonic anhydrase
MQARGPPAWDNSPLMRVRTTAGTLPPQDALQKLLEGNGRWVEGRPARVHRSAERRAELAGGQEPMATVFTCIDSRVAPEIVFDCAIGDLAVIRTGAHALDDAIVLGSLQFAAEILKTPLLLVMGHESCGAVRGAVDAITHGREVPGSMGTIVDALRPAYEAVSPAAAGEHELVELMVREHTRLTARTLAAVPTISRLVDRGSLAVQAGIYALDTGRVTLVD